MALPGDMAVVGAYLDDDGGDSSGSAYVFVKSTGGSWSQQAKLTASDGGGADFYGWSSSLSGSTALMGAYSADGAVGSSGAAYVAAFCGQPMVLVDGQWQLISLPCAPGTSIEQLFGDDGRGTYGTDWAQVERDEGNDQYHQLLYTGTLSQGAGYWIKVLGSSPVIDVFGAPTGTSSDPEVPLVDDTDPGRWNLVGHPFTFDVSWADVKVKSFPTNWSPAQNPPGTPSSNHNMWANTPGMHPHIVVQI